MQMDGRAVVATALLGMIALLAAGVPRHDRHGDESRGPSRGMGRAGTATRAARTLTKSLLIGEVALATALLVGAGVLVTSFVKLMAVEPGLDVRNVVTV